MKALTYLCLLSVLASPLAAQTGYRDGIRIVELGTRLRLDLPVWITRPTVLVLVEADDDSLPAARMAAAAREFGDSLAAMLRPTADSLGYIVEVRATTYRGAYDQFYNSHFLPNPDRGGGLLLFRPGGRPSRLLPYGGPVSLRSAIADYENRFRPAIPT